MKVQAKGTHDRARCVMSCNLPLLPNFLSQLSVPTSPASTSGCRYLLTISCKCFSDDVFLGVYIEILVEFPVCLLARSSKDT